MSKKKPAIPEKRLPYVQVTWPGTRKKGEAPRAIFKSSLPRWAEWADPRRPRIVCLCGSTRFHREFLEANLRETLAGRIVLGIGNWDKSDEELGITAEQKRMLDQLHLAKIDLADDVLILNKDGYIGDSTTREMQYAILAGKPVRFLEPFLILLGGQRIDVSRHGAKFNQEEKTKKPAAPDPWCQWMAWHLKDTIKKLGKKLTKTDPGMSAKEYQAWKKRGREHR